jgi:hypothetical protein
MYTGRVSYTKLASFLNLSRLIIRRCQTASFEFEVCFKRLRQKLKSFLMKGRILVLG